MGDTRKHLGLFESKAPITPMSARIKEMKNYFPINSQAIGFIQKLKRLDSLPSSIDISGMTGFLSPRLNNPTLIEIVETESIKYIEENNGETTTIIAQGFGIKFGLNYLKFYTTPYDGYISVDSVHELKNIDLLAKYCKQIGSKFFKELKLKKVFVFENGKILSNDDAIIRKQQAEAETAKLNIVKKELAEILSDPGAQAILAKSFSEQIAELKSTRAPNL